MTEIQWWPTTWERLTLRDMVKAPDGSVWEVRAAMSYEDTGWFTLVNRNGYVLESEFDLDVTVLASRPPGSDTPIDPKVLEMFAEILGATPTAPYVRTKRTKTELSWVKCGQTGECVCKR